MIIDDYEGGDGDNDDVDHDIAPVRSVVTMIAMHMIDDCRLHHFVLSSPFIMILFVVLPSQQ
jgi:hypothetical protein